MIIFNYESDFQLDSESVYAEWISKVILSEGKTEGEISYIFCDDGYLNKINVEYLGHDDFTDIISFDYSVGNEINGDIFISIERVKENAEKFAVGFNEELLRVMAHGILHYCGYSDKSDSDKFQMRMKEDAKISLFHVKQ
jgi:rRNA maturation RNase YbeY